MMRSTDLNTIYTQYKSDLVGILFALSRVHNKDANLCRMKQIDMQTRYSVCVLQRNRFQIDCLEIEHAIHFRICLRNSESRSKRIASRSTQMKINGIVIYFFFVLFLRLLLRLFFYVLFIFTCQKLSYSGNSHFTQ